jgi:hypothetical protein
MAGKGRLTAGALLRLTRAELDQKCRGVQTTRLPSGFARGTLVVYPSRWYSPVLAAIARLFWQGKRFDPERRIIVNQWFGLGIGRGEISLAPGWFDGKQSVVIEYNDGGSTMFAGVRDELKEIEPDLFLGHMYLRRQPPKIVWRMVLDLRAAPEK